MDDKTRPTGLYITRKDNWHIDENIGNSNGAKNDSLQWREDAIANELMSMGTINVHDVGDHNVTDW